MMRSRLLSGLLLGFGILYFLMPLLGTLEFSLRPRRGTYSLDAYGYVLMDPRFGAAFGYSAIIAVCTIFVGTAIVVATAYIVRLRLPRLRPFVEFVMLLPLIVPPIILVFGYIRMFDSASFLPLTSTARGTDVLLVLGYVTLALPYLYRSVDTGLRVIDVRTLAEAATILGAKQITIITRVIVPNILVAVLSGAFLTFAIVISEFVMASLLSRPAFGPYLQTVGAAKAYEPAALAIISFFITWGAMGLIHLLSRFAPKTLVKSP